MKNVQVSVRINDETAGDLKEMADDYGVKKSDLMRFCLEKGVHDLNQVVSQSCDKRHLERLLRAMDLRRIISHPDDYNELMEKEKSRF